MLRVHWVRSNWLSAPPCVSFRGMKNGRQKPTLSSDPSDIRWHVQKQFSRPMTGHTPRKLPRFTSNLPHHRIARSEKSADSPYTRLITIPPFFLFVKHIFRKNHKNLYRFSAILQILLHAAQTARFTMYISLFSLFAHLLRLGKQKTGRVFFPPGCGYFNSHSLI